MAHRREEGKGDGVCLATRAWKSTTPQIRSACDLHFNTEPLCSSFLIYLVSIHVAHEDRKSNSTT